MAVDSFGKRASATHFLTYNYTQLVIPDGTIGATDRQAATLVYSGIAAGGAAPITVSPERQRRHFLKNIGRGMG